MNKIQLGKFKVSTLGAEELACLLCHDVCTGLSILCINAHIYLLARKSVPLGRCLEDSDLLAVDGMSLVWLARVTGHKLQGRCNMTDAFNSFLKKDCRISRKGVLIGCSAEQAENATRYINDHCSHMEITRSVSGYLGDEEYELFLSNRQDDIILIGMGTPRSEQVVTLAKACNPGAVVWHIGGGTIQFLSGNSREAPEWMRKSGLQWLHRFFCEPGKMWPRYMVGLPLFALLYVKDVISGSIKKGGKPPVI